jgi:TonB-linked SusC/RagA family outer membrane protein
MQRTLLLLAFVFSGFFAVGQGRTVSGVVTDISSEALPGVNVIVKGTNTGTITDVNGKFQIDVPEGKSLLQFSYIGFENQQVEVSGKQNVAVRLQESAVGLKEVVVVGYGTVKKSDLTGSVGSVSSERITERHSAQLSQALQGAVSGVMVTRNNNAPGAGATIRVRGITTIGNSNPLIIVDGIAVGSMDQVNPNDVESISVLKDAASASIYGSRAAAGVVLITTKRAKENQLALSYNVEYGLEKPTTLPEYVSVTRFMEFVNETRWNDGGNTADTYPVYAKDLIDNYYTSNASNPDQYPITDWQRTLLQESAPRQSHVLSLSGGTNAVRSKASLVYDQSQGLVQNNDFDRLTFRLNNDFTINKYVSASLDLSSVRKQTEEPSAGLTPLIQNARLGQPIFAAFWSDGRIASGRDNGNIMGQVLEGGTTKNQNSQIAGKAGIDLTPFKGFKLSGVYSTIYNFSQAKKFVRKVPVYDAADPSLLLGYLSDQRVTSLQELRTNDYQRTLQFIASYEKSFGDHGFNLMAGNENYLYFNERVGASRDQYELDDYPYLNLGPVSFRGNEGSAYENLYRSYFGRIMYDYKDKYLLQANVRYDGSSRFDKAYRWGSFPSFSAGWVLTEEPFMKGLDFMPFLKIRASWGALGNDRIGNYPYQSTISFGNTLFYNNGTVVSKQSAAQTQYAIKSISWEKTQSSDIGMDMEFLNGRLSLSADYFNRTTKDMLLALEIPDYVGFDNPDQNTGKMNTKGFELETGWRSKIGELSYSVNGNLSDYKSQMGFLGGTEFLGDQVKKEGSQFNEWYGYRSEGLFQSQDEVTNSPKINNNVKPGDVRYKDISGPDGIPDGKITPDYDRVLLGGSLPRLMYGGNVNLSYKGIDLSFVVQGVGKQNVRYSPFMVQPLYQNQGNMQKIVEGRYWRVNNTEQHNLAAKYPRLSNNNANINYTMSDFWMFNGGYFRMKNISLGYNIPPAITQRIHVSRLRVYLTANDLFSLSHYPQGWDPEVGGNTYPITTGYIVGLHINL